MGLAVWDPGPEHSDIKVLLSYKRFRVYQDIIFESKGFIQELIRELNKELIPELTKELIRGLIKELI